jgi:2-polyprenyl-3-methyl-5-hydroxy-6-metoxy-1,4-benzoquinol methylase
MVSLDERCYEMEIMDDLDCSGEVVNQTLRELELINKWLGGNAVTINALSQVLKTVQKEQPHALVDLGCGGGDMLRIINRFARSKGYNLSLTGVDANPNIIAFAREYNKALRDVEFETVNILSPEFFQHHYDIAIGTLFFHHFTSDEISNFLQNLRGNVSTALIINDIHRHPLAYYSIRFLTSLFSKSSMVRFDAPLSVRRAFKRKELVEIIEKAGYNHYSLRWKWAFRWQVIIWMH